MCSSSENRNRGQVEKFRESYTLSHSCLLEYIE